jgi:RES domain-containing protein
MELFRLSKSQYASELSGEGARLFGGRWNSKGIEVIYTSETRSLALAETLVHLSLKRFTSFTHSLLVLTLPETTFVEEINLKELPADWNKFPSPPALANLGDKWAKDKNSVALKVPAAAVLGEYNFLLNPNHPEFKNIRWRIEKFPYDERIFNPPSV